MEWITGSNLFFLTSLTQERIGKGSNSNSKSNQPNFFCLCELQYSWLHTIKSLILEPLVFSNLPNPVFSTSNFSDFRERLMSSRPLILSFLRVQALRSFQLFGVLFLLNFLVSVCGMSWSTHKDVISMSRQNILKSSWIILQCLSVVYTDLP